MPEPGVSAADWGRPPPGDWDPLAILAEGALTADRAKTAVGVIRYGDYRVAAVIDSTRSPGEVSEHLGVGRGIPVVAGLEEALALGARALLVGIAPRGGALPLAWRPTISGALARGLNVASGLHTLLGEDAEMAAAASGGNSSIWDLRREPPALPLAAGRREEAGARVILTVGSDCHTGKMTAAFELHRAAERRGRSSALVPTGQTGIFIARRGVAVDRLPGDFISGVVEEMVNFAQHDHELVWVEGQGTLYHPAYSGVALGLLHGSLADGLILCHVPGREKVAGYDTVVPALGEVIRRHEEAASWVRPSPVVGISLSTEALSPREAEGLLRRVEEETGLPTTDCVRLGAERLVEAVEGRE